MNRREKFIILFSGENLCRFLKLAERQQYAYRYNAEVSLAFGLVQMWEQTLKPRCPMCMDKTFIWIKMEGGSFKEKCHVCTVPNYIQDQISDLNRRTWREENQ